MIFLGTDISGIILFLKILGFLLSLSFMIGIVISWLGGKKISAVEGIKKANHFNLYQDKQETSEQKRWESIQLHFQSQNPAEWRMAIIDADAMLEDAITKMGYNGSSFGEKLKSMNKSHFPHLDAAWYVHKVRNNLAHQGTQYHLSDREAYQVFKTYEQIFYEIGYIA